MKHHNTLFVTVHTESTYNKRKFFTGHIDAKLTKKGIREAKKLADILKNEQIDVAYSSPLTRAKDTLKYILLHHPHALLYIDSRLIERDYGELSGKSKIKFEKDHPELYPIYHRSFDVPPPKGESIFMVEQRVMPLIKEIIQIIRSRHINIILCAHKNTIRPIRKYFEHLTPEETMKLEHKNDQIYKYSIE